MDNSLKLTYNEILLGRSPFSYKDSAVFIKHLTNIDLSLIDIYREEQLQYALNKGAISYKDRLNTIIQDKSWTVEKDNQIDEIKSFLINLKHSKTKYTLDRDKKSIDKEIKFHEDRLFNLTIEKDKLIGKTAEQFSDKKVNEYYLYVSLFEDADLRIRLFKEEEFDELNEFELIQLLMAYNKKMELFNHNSFKKIALSPNFSNLFYLCEDNIYAFYGRPIIELSFYQLEVFQWAKQFRNMLQNSKIQPPVEIMGDADKLFEWFENINKADEFVNNPNIPQETDKEIVIGGSSMVGATQEDYKKYGLEGSENKKMMEKLKQKSELTWEDLI